MKKRFGIFLALICASTIAGFAQAPAIQWAKCFGGTEDDIAYSVEQTMDDGFIIAGYTRSNDGDVTGNHSGASGVHDYWIVKLDSNGSMIWQKCLGGSGGDLAYSIKQTIDGGFIISGFTLSNDGDVSGNHSNNSDYWIVKTDSFANIQWQKCFGGSGPDFAYEIQQTFDSGYVVTGIEHDLQNDGDVIVSYGDGDYWVLKLDKTGNLQWQKTLGGSAYENTYSILQTSDSGYVVAGNSSSNDWDVAGQHGAGDNWIVKLDPGGNKIWTKCYGGTSDEGANYIIENEYDRGFIMAGATESNDIDVSGNHGSNDIWVVKTDSIGSIRWQKCIGGSFDDIGWSVQATRDSGLILAGSSSSHDGNVVGNYGSGDYFIFKMDSIGNIEWTKCLGGTDDEQANCIRQTRDGGYIVAGGANSNNGDVIANHSAAPDNDFWVVKLSPSGTNIPAESPITDFSASLSDKLSFTLNSAVTCNCLLQLIDITGRTILEQQIEIKNGFNKNEIQIPLLSRAVYLVRLKTESGSVTTKVIKQ